LYRYAKAARAEGTEIAQFQRENGGGGAGGRAGSSRKGGSRQPLKTTTAAAAADNRSAQGAAGKMPKWKRQSEMFRAGLRANIPDAGGSGGGLYRL
jgi:hypothetical protein